MIRNKFEKLLTPEVVTVIGSIILSAIAIGGVVTIGKDGALYMDLARQIDEYGFAGIFNQFNWPWISLLIAFTHKITGLGYETVAYLYSIVFMATVSLLTVLIVKQKDESAAWWAALIVLSVPVFNSFRYEIIRETGFWCFIVLAVWIIQKEGLLSWSRGFAFQLAVAAAVLFRFEAIFILLAANIYYLVIHFKDGIRDSILFQLKVSWVYLLCVLAAMFFLAMMEQPKFSRIIYQLSLLEPSLLYLSFMDTSNKFAEAALMRWSYSDAPKMLFAGILFVLLYRTLVYIGIISFLLVRRSSRREFVYQAVRFKFNAVSAILYFIVLFVFFVQVKFVNSRYMTLLVLLLLPMMIMVVSKFFAENKKWVKPFILLSVLIAISNVISFGDKKTHYISAAKWIRDNISQEVSIYYEDARIQYYAGRGYGEHKQGDVALITEYDRENYKYFIVEYSKSVSEEFFQDLGFNVVSSFSSRKKTVFILQ